MHVWGRVYVPVQTTVYTRILIWLAWIQALFSTSASSNKRIRNLWTCHVHTEWRMLFACGGRIQNYFATRTVVNEQLQRGTLLNITRAQVWAAECVLLLCRSRGAKGLTGEGARSFTLFAM